ncbi:hypothetical protein GBN26_15305, partial [Plesiomonas shigelloides]|uniref:hypothetical protein n=1 Tax=Plesiomonas shigelloides TaxID=703 RepID=UPI0012629749
MPHKDTPNKASKSYGPYNSFLLKPFLSLSDKTLKIRRNLNITSIISIAITTLGITVRDISFSGMKIDGVTNDKLLLVLTCILSYHLISFLWYSYDEYWKWRLHLIKEEEISEEKRATGTYSLSPAQIATDK